MKHSCRQTTQVTRFILSFVKQFTGAHIRHTATEQKATFICCCELFPALVLQTLQIAKENYFLLTDNRKNEVSQPRKSKSRNRE